MSYTIQEAREVMAETDRILRQDERLRKSGRVTARAHAAPRQPAADDLFFDYVGQVMDREGCSRSAAIRLVAIEKPTLHKAWLDEFNQQHQQKEASARQDATRARTARNR